MSSLQTLHNQLHAKLHRQANAVEITEQQLEDVRELIAHKERKGGSKTDPPKKD